MEALDLAGVGKQRTGVCCGPQYRTGGAEFDGDSFGLKGVTVDVVHSRKFSVGRCVDCHGHEPGRCEQLGLLTGEARDADAIGDRHLDFAQRAGGGRHRRGVRGAGRIAARTVVDCRVLATAVARAITGIGIVAAVRRCAVGIVVVRRVVGGGDLS